MTDILLITADSIRADIGRTLAVFEDVCIAAAPWTRPAMAGLLSSRLQAAADTRAQQPTLPAVLSDHGYTTIGRAPTAQVAPTFGFADGVDDYESYVDRGTEGSRLRQTLSKSSLLRSLYYRVKSPTAKADARPADEDVLEDLIAAWRDADSPRFAWWHLMESHRPYGRGADGLDAALDRKAAIRPADLTMAEPARIRDTYVRAVRRCAGRIQRALDVLDPDVAVVTADHGEMFGERGWYFHQGHYRCVAPQLVRVPIAWRGVDVQSPMQSHFDIAPTLAAAAGVASPSAWIGRDLTAETRDRALCVAPWEGEYAIGLHAPDYWGRADPDEIAVDLEARRQEPSASVATQLRDLGYTTTG